MSDETEYRNPKDVPPIFNERLKYCIDTCYQSRKEAAAEIGITAATLSYYISGKNQPNAAMLVNIASSLPGVSLDYLLGMSNELKSPHQVASDSATINRFLEIIKEYPQFEKPILEAISALAGVLGKPQDEQAITVEFMTTVMRDLNHAKQHGNAVAPQMPKANVGVPEDETVISNWQAKLVKLYLYNVNELERAQKSLYHAIDKMLLLEKTKLYEEYSIEARGQYRQIIDSISHVDENKK